MDAVHYCHTCDRSGRGLGSGNGVDASRSKSMRRTTRGRVTTGISYVATREAVSVLMPRLVAFDKSSRITKQREPPRATCKKQKCLQDPCSRTCCFSSYFSFLLPLRFFLFLVARTTDIISPSFVGRRKATRLIESINLRRIFFSN